VKDMVQVRRGPVKQYQGPEARIGRSQFNRSHGVKMTFDASYLYPILLDEVLPGDTFTCKLNGFARIFSPLDAPVMDNIELETFFFFCPTRLLWSNWQYFNGEHDAAGAQDTDYTIPVMATGLTVDHNENFTFDGLAAFLGLPHGLASSSNTDISALPFRMYNRIYNEWFKDQNLSPDLNVNTGNGPDALADYKIIRGNKKHDYFTSALPYLQKGTAIEFQAPVSGIGAVTQTFGLTSQAVFETGKSGATVYPFAQVILDPLTSDSNIGMKATAASSAFPEIYANLDINGLRQSVAIQRLLERDARGGTRYVELIKAHFGVTSPDFRLQRPEYLGGGKSFINITPVANTSATATEDQAELRGVGTGVISGHSWAKSFTEHGYVMGLVRARGDITYFQGLDKLWTRSTRYDFYIPALANLGEQAILNKEIFVTNSGATDNAVFGYQERWAEYRMKQSRVVGTFNPDAAGNLGFWHLAEDFSAVPPLNTAFVNDNTPMGRITTTVSQPDFLLDLWFDYKCARPIPVYSVPSLIGRF